MSRRIEFENHIKRLVNIFFLCKESYLVELYSIKENSEYLIDLKYNGSFFMLTKVNYWRIIVLQLSKLYIDNDKEYFNIKKFLNNRKTGERFSLLDIDQIFINEQLKKISKKQHLIDNIRIQRNKVFAHDDPRNGDIVNDVTLDQTKDLIELCQDLIFKIYQEVYDTHYDFEMGNSPKENLMYILKSLDEANNNRTV
ncbi:hypothetical protein [Chryseobacterium sp.]|uniref:AbiU2 domain-containing protein n=1 Tax=Chryseobacterium sp. TaxID=1871047 RepID=UPI00333F7B63